MYEQIEKAKESKSRAVANSGGQKKGSKQNLGFVNNRLNTVAQRKALGLVSCTNCIETPTDVSCSKKSVAQLTVLSRRYQLTDGRFRTKYYSTYDTDREFDDHLDAWRYDTELALANRNFSYNDRYPTPFTYYNVNERNVVGTVPQGPHTISHSSLSYRLKQQYHRDKLKALRDQQVPTLIEFNDLLTTELPARLKKSQIGRMRRMLKDYELLYNRLNQIIEGEIEYNEEEAKELLMRLIQMHPYSAYGKGKKVSKSRIKGKGEREDAKFDDAFDNMAKFNSNENYTNFSRKRKRLWEDSEESIDPGINKQKAKRRKVTREDDALSPIDVMIILGRTTSGSLYIMDTDDWDAYEQYKKDNPDKKYKR